jgi:hypothetical protein
VKNYFRIVRELREKASAIAVSGAGALCAVALVFLMLTFVSTASAAGVVLKLGDILVIDSSGGLGGVSRLFVVDYTTTPATQTIISEGGLLQESVGVVFAPDGDILVLDRVNGLIRVNPFTQVQSVVSAGQNFKDPFGLIIGTDGYIYVADSGFRPQGPGPYVNVAGKIIRILPGPSNNNQQVIASGNKNGTCSATDVSDPSQGATACLNQPTAGQYLNHPFGIGVDTGSGKLLVSDMSAFGGRGAIVSINPEDLPTDPEGNPVTTNQNLPQTLIWGPDNPIAQPLVRHADPQHIYGCPMGITVEQNGNILASVFAIPFDSNPVPPFVYGCSVSGIFRVNLANNAQEVLTSSAGFPTPPSGFSYGWKVPFGMDTEVNTNIVVVDALAAALYRVKAQPSPGLYGEFVPPFDPVTNPPTIFLPATFTEASFTTGVAVIKKEPDGGFKGSNSAPVITSVTGPTVSQKVGVSVSVTGRFTDEQLGDNHTCTLNWGDGVTTPGTITPDTASTPGSCTGSHAYTVPGTYSVVVTVSDDSLSGTLASAPFAVYDPDSSVKGTGEINSPAGSYKPNPQLAGSLKFAFLAKFKNNTTTPQGITLLHYRAGRFLFLSISVNSLVVNGNKATYTGTGYGRVHSLKHFRDQDCEIQSHFLSGIALYNYRITAQDGGGTTNAGDTVRIQIWKPNATNPADESGKIYDNGIDSPLTKGKITLQ